MNTTLNITDYAALSPLLILLGGALLVLLVESFFSKEAKKITLVLTLISLAIALYAAYFAPASTNPLLTPWLRFDSAARFFTLLFLAIGVASTLLASAFFSKFEQEYPEVTHGEYYFLLLSSIIGIILIGASADFLTLFLGLETLSIALYILCGYMKKWKISHEAAMKYFLMGALGASFLIYGIALVYGATGTTRFNLLLPTFKLLSSSSSEALFFSGIALITVGLAFKAAIVPFHVWAPDVYDGAPNPVTAFMAVGTKAGAFAAFAVVFLIALPRFDPLWNQGISFLAFPTLIYANFVAMRQTQLRRFFAYSGISHAGYLLIPLAAGTPDAMPALVFYLAVYSLATMGCFAVLAFLDHGSDGVILNDLRGLFRTSPILAGFFALCLLTLAGIPPTAGFLAKFYVLKVGFEAGYYALVIVALLVTVFSAYYYLRIVSIMLADPSSETEKPQLFPSAVIVGLVCFVGILLISCYPAPLINLLALITK